MIYLSLEAALPLLQGCDQSWQLYYTLKNTVVFVRKELQTYICSWEVKKGSPILGQWWTSPIKLEL